MSLKLRNTTKSFKTLCFISNRLCLTISYFKLIKRDRKFQMILNIKVNKHWKMVNLLRSLPWYLSNIYKISKAMLIMKKAIKMLNQFIDKIKFQLFTNNYRQLIILKILSYIKRMWIHNHQTYQPVLQFWRSQSQ